MNKLSYEILHQPGSTSSEEMEQKVFQSLVHHVYLQTNVAMVASIFCASVVFIGLYSLHGSNALLYSWFGLFLLITFCRVLVVNLYHRHSGTPLKFWANLYVLSALLGGMSWGLAGVMLFSSVDSIQQTLMILMLAGVTAGALPLYSAVLSASILFLVTSILPFIIVIATLNNSTYLLFDMALSLYLIYMIILSIRAHKLIESMIVLKFEKEALVATLSRTTERAKSEVN